MIDTLKYVKILEEVGFSKNQAESSVKVFLGVMSERFATKEDHIELKHEVWKLRTEFHQFKGEVTRRLDKLDVRVDRLESRMDRLEQRVEEGFAKVDQRFEALEARMDRRFEKVDQRFESLETKFATKKDLDVLKAEMTNRLGAMTVAGITFAVSAVTLIQRLF